MTTYQIAEALGKWPGEVREALTQAELYEWSYFLNSSFSFGAKAVLMNGWLVHVVRSIVADKRKRPKFSESVFPFDKVARDFFDKPKVKAPVTGKAKTMAEVEHMAQIHRRNAEKALREYKAGKKTNRFGLFIGERLKK